MAGEREIKRFRLVVVANAIGKTRFDIFFFFLRLSRGCFLRAENVTSFVDSLYK